MSPAGRIDLAPGTWIAASDLDIDACRSGGPGGQHVNTTASAALIRLDPRCIHGLDAAALLRLRRAETGRIDADGLLLWRCDEHRSLSRNKAAIIERIAASVADCLIAPLPRKKVKPTRASRQRRLDGKRRRSTTKAQRRSTSDD